jgi:hypothetical protein
MKIVATHAKINEINDVRSYKLIIKSVRFGFALASAPIITLQEVRFRILGCDEDISDK